MIVAGEESGDILGAGLIRELKLRYPQCEFEGIGGERMIAEGLHSLYPMERLSVMGFIDPLLRLPELLSIIRHLKRKLNDDVPSMFIGIDSPDFTIRLEAYAKRLGVFSTHYVSPSVWAWRKGRVKKIKRSVDLMLTVFPFEAKFYQDHKVDVEFIGHPLADKLPLDPDKFTAKQALGLTTEQDYIALLPGSRKSELRYLLPIFLELAEKLGEFYPKVQFLLPAANKNRKQEILAALSIAPNKRIHVFDGQSHELMCASDFVVMASGTTTLEAMLLKRPMLISYKMSRVSWAIFSRLVRLEYVGLPNLLAGKKLVPEFLQGNATPSNLFEASKMLIEDTSSRKEMLEEFYRLHKELRQDASINAARAIVERWERFDGK